MRLLATTRAEVADLRRGVMPELNVEEQSDADALELGLLGSPGVGPPGQLPGPSGLLVPIGEVERVTWAPDDEYHDPVVEGSVDRAEDHVIHRRRLEDRELERDLDRICLFRGEDLPEYSARPEGGDVIVPGIPIREPMTHSLPVSRAPSPSSSSE